MLRNRQEAEDVTQEVFIAVLARSETFRGDADVTTWLYRIATNRCLNHLRSRSRSAHRETHEAALAWQDVAPADPYQQVEARDMLARVLERCDELDQEVFVLKVMDGLTQDEIASVTGRSRRTIGTRLRRVEAFVAEQLGDRP
jgi:RNA polymerase sigma factor (sigma-70 family)